MTPLNIRDRIKSLVRIPAGQLIPNQKNWRKHPQKQRDALRGVLEEIGYVDALLARETPDGLLLIDGHLRAETTPEMEVPVLILDVTEDEADKILATFDPLSALAEADSEKLAELLQGIETNDEALQQMLDDLAQNEGILPPDFAPATLDEQGVLDEKAKVTCPECGHEFAP